MDFAELKTMLRDFPQCDQAVFQNNVPQFVKAAERNIYQFVRTPDSRATVTSGVAAWPTLTAGVNTIQAPPDFREPLQFVVPSLAKPSLLLKEPSFIIEAYNGAPNGPPRYYAIQNVDTTLDQSTVLLLGPTPDLSYNFQLSYARVPPSIIDQGVTWLSANCHTALLYGSLVEGYKFLKDAGNGPDASTFAAYNQNFIDAKNEVKRICEGLQKMDSFRNTETRVPV